MTTQNIGLFEALNAKMGYLNQRQRVISQNVANADTPGYRPQDLTPVDFGTVLKKVTKGGQKNVSIEKTDNMHMTGADDVQNPKERKQRETYEVAPVGNAVIMEEQLINAGKNMMDYNLMTSLYQKNVGMLKTAIGRGQ